jgi:hypothetical protein
MKTTKLGEHAVASSLHLSDICLWIMWSPWIIYALSTTSWLQPKRTMRVVSAVQFGRPLAVAAISHVPAPELCANPRYLSQNAI